MIAIVVWHQLKHAAIIRQEEASSSSSSSTGKPKQLYNGFSRVSKYRALYQLVEHIDCTPGEEQIQYCLAAIILATALQNKLESLNGKSSQQYSSSSGKLPEGWGSLEEVAALVYRHIGQLVCNGYAIYQVLGQADMRPMGDGGAGDWENASGIESLSQERLASAIYATASLMNHSCKPTTINSYMGNLLVIRTISDVKAGEQVYSCYGPHYCRHSRSERQSVLQQQYHFTCQCQPCTDMHYLTEERRWCGLKCESCGGIATYGDESEEDESSTDGGGKDGAPGSSNEAALLTCHECGVVSPPTQRLSQLCSRTQELHRLGESAMRSQAGNLQQAVQDLQEAVKMGETIYCLDNQFLASIQDTYAMVLAAHGSYRESGRVLRGYVQTVERRYGGASVELGHELVKYHRILQEQSNGPAARPSSASSMEIKDIESRIASIFTVNYGSKWKSILNIHI